MLTLTDLKKQGLKLSQLDAQEIHSKINGISQGHIADGIVFAGGETNTAKTDPLKAYYEQLQELNSSLLKENGELRDGKISADAYQNLSEINHVKNNSLAVIIELLKKVESNPIIEEIADIATKAFENDTAQNIKETKFIPETNTFAGDVIKGKRGPKPK